MKKTVHILLLIVMMALICSTRSLGATVKTRVTGAANWNTATTWIQLRTGTAAFTNGSATVTGTGTLFTTELQAGDVLILDVTPGTVRGTVSSIQSNTSLTLTATATANASGAYGREAVPTSSDDVQIGNTGFSAAVTVTLDVAFATVNSLTFIADNQAHSLTHGGTNALTVTNNVTINQPTTNSLTIAWNVNAGSATVNGNVTIGGTNSTTSRIAKIALTTGILTIAGNLIYNSTSSAAGTAVVDLSGGSATLNLAGSLTLNNSSGTLTPGTTSTFNYNGTSVAQTVRLASAIIYNNLNLNNTNASGATLGASITATNVTGNLSVQSGTLNNGGFAITLSSGKNFSASNGATFNITGTSTMVSISGGGTKTFGATSTTNYSGGIQVVTAETYGNLGLSGGANKTMPVSATMIAGNFSMTGAGTSATAAAAINTSGNFSVGSGATFTTGVFTHDIKGNFTNDGTFTAIGSTVTLSGTAVQAIGGSTTTAFNNLTISNASAAVSANTSFDVNGTLTMSANAVLIPAASVVIGGAGTLTGSGSIKVTRTAATPDFLSQYTITTKTLTNLTVDYDATAAQTVNALNYANLTISGNRAGSTVTFASGTIGVSGTLSPNATSVVYSATGNTVDYNGAGAQGIAAFNYNNLTISGSRGGATVTLASGTIAIAATFNPSATSVIYSTTGNTIDYNGVASQTVTVFLYNNLNFSNSGSKSISSSITAAGGVAINAGASVTLAPGVTLQANGNMNNAGSLTSSGTILVGP